MAVGGLFFSVLTSQILKLRLLRARENLAQGVLMLGIEYFNPYKKFACTDIDPEGGS